MSQPPDDRSRMPWEPAPSEAADDPTVPWTPADIPPPPDASPPPEPSSPVDAEPPAPPDAEPPAPPEAAAPPEDVGSVPTSADEPAPTGPLLSAGTTAPIVDWQPTADRPAPTVGWQQPDAGAEPAPVEGYVIAGPWARLVAWLIDSLLVTIVPSILSFVVIDWRPFMEAMVRQAQDPTLAPATITMPTTVETLIVSVIGVGLSYLYFVGFWTGPWMATPGMRLLRLKVGHQQRGAELSLIAATKRWFAMGAWLGLLAYVGPLAAVSGFGVLLLEVMLFISVIVNVRRQGLHDRFAESIVIRERASGDGAVAMGCAVLIGLIVLATIVFGAVFFSIVWPVMEPFMDEIAVPR